MSYVLIYSFRKLIVVLLLLGLGFSTGFAQIQLPAPVAPSQPPADKDQALGPTKQGWPVATDQYGDRLPSGAIARLGAVRFRNDSDAWGLIFSRDGKLLVGNTGSGVVIWEASTGREVQRLPIRVGSLSNRGGLDVSPDGNTLALVEILPATQISLWDMQSGKKTRTIPVPTSSHLANPEAGSTLRFAPDGKTLAMTYNGKFLIFDVAKGQERASFGEISASIYDLAFAPDGKTLAIATHDPCMQLWDIAAGTMIHGIRNPEKRIAAAVAFSPDGKIVAWGTWNRITLCDPVTGKQLGHLYANVRSIQGLSFTPDGKTLVSCGTYGGRVWDVATGKVRFTLDSRMICRSMALSRDGRIAAIGTAGSVVRLWHVATGKELFTEFQGHNSGVNCLAFSPDGKTLASGEYYDQIRLWDAEGWKKSRVLLGRAWSLSFSPDGRRLASAPRDNTVHVWDMTTGKKAMVIKVPGVDDVRLALFSADGGKLITLDRKRDDNGTPPLGPHNLRHWNATSGQQEDSWIVPGPMYEPVVAPDGMGVLVANKSTIRLHDVRSGRDRGFRGSGTSEVRALAVSRNSKVLVSGDLSGDFAVRLWEIATGKEIQILKGHECKVTAADCSPDGQLVASADNNEGYGPSENVANTVRLWHAISGKEVARFGGLNSVVTSLAFSPDGAHVAGGLNDGTILVWDVNQPNRESKR